MQTGSDCFLRIPGKPEHGSFAPARYTVGILHFNENGIFIRNIAKAGTNRRFQPHTDMVQCNVPQLQIYPLFLAAECLSGQFFDQLSTQKLIGGIPRQLFHKINPGRTLVASQLFTAIAPEFFLRYRS